MGLDTTHDCWHGAYSAFMRWRRKVCEVAGYGKLADYDGFGGDQQFIHDDPLAILLSHSDCDGNIWTEDCESIAEALTALLPAMARADNGNQTCSYLSNTTKFIYGLKEAADAMENVEFH